MIFLTEEDVRQRCELGQGGEFRLQAGERLTPAATELLRSRNCRVILPGQCTVEAAPVEEAGRRCRGSCRCGRGSRRSGRSGCRTGLVPRWNLP